MLNGTELKYYKPNRRALKGVINLDSWCKLVKGQSPECFQLVTPKKTYHLVCKSEQECMEWLQGTWLSCVAVQRTILIMEPTINLYTKTMSIAVNIMNLVILCMLPNTKHPLVQSG